jgi:Amiloride-sensitive sodium channel
VIRDGLEEVLTDQSFSRFFWGFAMILMFFVFGLLVYETVTKYTSEKVMLELAREETSIREVPFPAVTMCPEVFYRDALLSHGKNSYIPVDDR